MLLIIAWLWKALKGLYIPNLLVILGFHFTICWCLSVVVQIHNFELLLSLLQSVLAQLEIICCQLLPVKIHGLRAGILDIWFSWNFGSVIFVDKTPSQDTFENKFCHAAKPLVNKEQQSLCVYIFACLSNILALMHINYLRVKGIMRPVYAINNSAFRTFYFIFKYTRILVVSLLHVCAFFYCVGHVKHTWSDQWAEVSKLNWRISFIWR